MANEDDFAPWLADFRRDKAEWAKINARIEEQEQRECSVCRAQPGQKCREEQGSPSAVWLCIIPHQER